MRQKLIKINSSQYNGMNEHSHSQYICLAGAHCKGTPNTYCTDFIHSTIITIPHIHVHVYVCTGGGGSKARRLESRQIKDYFGCVTSGIGGHAPSSPPTASVGVQTELTAHHVADLEGRSQTSSQVTSLQSRVTELEHYLTICKEKLESTTARLNKCLSVGKELLIEKVNKMCG